MFSRILIANRGEIAVRIIRACREMGISTVAVYSEADRGALHTLLADEAICIGPGPAKESYLDQNRIIGAALASKAAAIHPGYGFLSENAGFARLCRENSIAFIGPDSDLMLKLADKAAMKRIAMEAGLPAIPGTDTLHSLEEAQEKASAIGYPLMLKASAGGGGRGIRPIETPEQLESVWPIARKEAESAFSDDGLYLEKLIVRPRHIEVQIMADEAGHAVAFPERDCSLQRNHQKLIEESPSPAVSAEQRENLLAACEEAVRRIGYTGIGTLEFLLAEDGNLFFMEMNVRLQVEHGVTEMLTGTDLVKWQIRLAAGIPLDFSGKDVRGYGHAAEVRVNAMEGGHVSDIHIPGGAFIRFDTAMVPGTNVPPYYDPLIGKLIALARTRDEMIRKLRTALCELVVTGIATDIPRSLSLLERPEFTQGKYDTSMMEGR